MWGLQPGQLNWLRARATPSQRCRIQCIARCAVQTISETKNRCLRFAVRELAGLKLLDGVLALVPAGWCWKLETQGTRSPKTGLGQQSNPWGSLWARNGLKKQSAQERQIADDWIHHRNIGMVCKSLSWWSSNISCQALLPHLPPASGAWYLPACVAENPPWRVEDHGAESHPYVYLGRILICDAFIKWEDKRIRVRRNPTSWQQLARLTSFKFNYIYNIENNYEILCCIPGTEQDGSYTTTDRPWARSGLVKMMCEYVTTR